MPLRQLTDSQLMANEIESVYRQFVYMPNEQSYTLCTLWVAATHLRDSNGIFQPYQTGRLYFGSRRAGCGKSQTTEITVRMSHNGVMMVEPSPPSVVARMNVDHATVGFDEIDTYFGRGTGKQSMRGILNAGYKKGATVDNIVAGEVEAKNVHGPIVMNGKNYNRFTSDERFETLYSRSHVIELTQAPADAYLEEFMPEIHDARLRDLMTRLSRWGIRHHREILAQPIDALGIDPRIRNRSREIWAVLYRVANHLGGDWPRRCDEAARAMVLGEWADDDTPTMTPVEQLLTSVQACFSADEFWVSTDDILTRLAALPIKPTIMTEWRTAHSARCGLGHALNVFGIKSVRMTDSDGEQRMGYLADDCGANDSTSADQEA